MATLYTATGRIKHMRPRGATFSLLELQKAVGGFIEVLKLKKDKALVCNENGRALRLKLNESGTAAARRLGAFPSLFIVGDCLICDIRELNLCAKHEADLSLNLNLKEKTK